jgi:hypothetical protein
MVLFPLISFPEQRLELLREPVYVTLPLLTAMPPLQNPVAQQPQEQAEYYPPHEERYGHALRLSPLSTFSIPGHLNNGRPGGRLHSRGCADGARRGWRHAEQHGTKEGDHHGSVQCPARHHLLLASLRGQRSIKHVRATSRLQQNWRMPRRQ